VFDLSSDPVPAELELEMKTNMVRAVMLLPLALLIMAPMLIPAHATALTLVTTPTLVTGQASASNQSETVLSTSGNILVALITSQIAFTGGIQGAGSATAIAYIDTSTGQLVFTEQISFTGTVLGSQSGTANIFITGNGTLGGASQAHDVLNQGAGGLSGIQSEGNQSTAAGSTITTYSLLVKFNNTISVIDTLTINSTAKPITGYYTTLWQNGNQLASCFSPCQFAVNNGQTYQIAVADYGSEYFAHWQDGSTNRFYTVNVPSASTTIPLTATYNP
jgi:hypothetical protein